MGFRDQVRRPEPTPQPLRLEGKRVKYLCRNDKTNEHVFLHFRKKSEPPHRMASYTTDYLGERPYQKTDWIFIKIVVIGVIVAALVLVMM